MENRSVPMYVCRNAREGNVVELSRLTKATFLSVRTQTNAKAKAIWHAALDDIWEAGSGGGGGVRKREGGGGSAIRREQTIVRRIVAESAL